MSLFSRLTDFGYQRSKKEAFGFYIVYLLLTMIAGGVISGTAAALLDFTDVYQASVRIGTGTALVVCVGLSFAVLKQKKLLGNLGLVALAALSGVIALFGGALIGLIAVAFLTTRPNGVQEASSHS